MEQLFSNKPVGHLEVANNMVKKYILLLEEELKKCVSVSNLNKEYERKLLNMQKELNSLKLQKKEYLKNEEIQKNEISKIKNANIYLNQENKKLWQQIVTLQTDVEREHKENKVIETPTVICNKKNAQTATDDDDDQTDANSVLVKGLTERQINIIPKITIAHLGRLMDINLLENDIVKVTTKERKFYEKRNLKPSKILLIVELRTPELKIEFLKNKNKLTRFSNLEEIEITDYVSDKVYNLYQYAKILKTCGFAQIYWRNNCIYAKKTSSTLCEPIIIKSKNDVDALNITM